MSFPFLSLEETHSLVPLPQYRDFLHPDVLPGSYVWGDILFYECVSLPRPLLLVPSDLFLFPQVETGFLPHRSFRVNALFLLSCCIEISLGIEASLPGVLRLAELENCGRGPCGFLSLASVSLPMPPARCCSSHEAVVDSGATESSALPRPAPVDRSSKTRSGTRFLSVRPFLPLPDSCRPRTDLFLHSCIELLFFAHASVTFLSGFLIADLVLLSL